jgi:hypothetical protein
VQLSPANSDPLETLRVDAVAALCSCTCWPLLVYSLTLLTPPPAFHPVCWPRLRRKAAKVHIRLGGLALLAVIGIGVAAVTACSSVPGSPAASSSSPGNLISSSALGSATSSPVAPSSPNLVPAGYKRVGGAAQGISVAAPASWVSVNLAKETVQSAANKIGLSGVSASTIVQDMETLQSLHAVIVFDLKSAVDSSQHFSRNLNAYCDVSGVTDAGSAGVPILKTSAAAELEKAGATHVSQKDIEIGGVPGVESFYQLTTSEGTLYGSQLEVLPTADKACFVTLTVGTGEAAGNVLSTAAATARFP